VSEVVATIDGEDELAPLHAEIAEKLPAGWELETLGSLCEKSQYGWTTKADKLGGDIKFLRTTDITPGVVDWQSVPYCMEAPADLEKYLIKDGDILISRTGSIGVNYLVVKPEPAVFASYLIRFRPKKTISTKYLKYYLQSPAYWRAINAGKKGIAVQNVNATMLSRIPVPVAPLSVQEEIVAEIEKQFSRLDEAVANLQRVKANLKRYKASVLKAAVEGRLVETEASIAQREGRSYETGEQLLQSTLEARKTQWVGRGKYKSPEPPQVFDASLPEGWAWASLEQLHLQIADVDHKMPKAQESGIPYISTKDFFGDEGIDFSKAKLISAEDYEGLCRKVKPERGDLLLSRYGTVGEVREVCVDEPFQASYSVAILKPVRGFVPIRFLIAALRSDVVQRQIKRDVRATAQPDLGLAHIRQFVVPVPPMAEQLRILEELDRQLSILRGIETEVENNLMRAQSLRQSTLSKAFT
jgi:type I restriction enzyme S subunit